MRDAELLQAWHSRTAPREVVDRRATHPAHADSAAQTPGGGMRRPSRAILQECFDAAVTRRLRSPMHSTGGAGYGHGRIRI